MSEKINGCTFGMFMGNVRWVCEFDTIEKQVECKYYEASRDHLPYCRHNRDPNGGGPSDRCACSEARKSLEETT